MIVRDLYWNLIRDQFTDEEMSALRRAVTGRACYPMGYIVERELIEDELLTKLVRLIAKAREAVQFQHRRAV